MGSASRLLLALTSLSTLAADSTESSVMEVLLLADIGHSREHKDRRTKPKSIMGKSAFEGAFSLYDGLTDFVLNRGARVDAVIIAGDVAYGGGAADVLNDTQEALQTYLRGHVPVEKVYPLIGNHDVNILGCMVPTPPHMMCYYGSKEVLFLSQEDLSFEQWRANWMGAFPGLRTAITPGSPPLHGVSTEPSHDWLAPLRYNLNLNPESSVYVIVGLISGARALDWGPQTPPDAVDGMSTTGDAIECQFLRDSLAHGRSVGKTVFIYFTHNFDHACSDWSLIQQMDVWIYGHKHNMWQSADEAAIVDQDRRHYPIRFLIGNGGFDNGIINVVSFVHLREEVVSTDTSGSNETVRIHFDVYDTCISDWCPENMPLPTLNSCWKACKDMPGGYDGGGGPRKATPSAHGFGFSLEAPRKPRPHPRNLPLDGSGTLEVASGNVTGWLSLGSCGSPTWIGWTCLVLAAERNKAGTFAFFDGDGTEKADAVNTRIAVVSEAGEVADGRGPVMAENEGDFLYEHYTFWDSRKGAGEITGEGLMRPSDGAKFSLQRSSTDRESWFLQDVALESEKIGEQLVRRRGSRVQVIFHPEGKVHDLEFAFV